MFKMKIWEKTFEIWQNFCPYYRRRLLTREDLLSWATKANFIDRFSHRQEHFNIFIKLLNEIEVLCPLTRNGELLDPRFYKQPGVIHLGRIDEPQELDLYHPIQFIEIINWLIQSSYSSTPYYKNDEYLEYCNLRSLEIKIIDLKKTIRQLEHYNDDISHSEKALKEYEERYNSSKKDYPKGDDLRRLLKIRTPIWKLNEEKLETWIKIESLVAPIGSEMVSPLNVNLVPIRKVSEEDIYEFNKGYKSWRDDIMKYHQNYIKFKDIKLMEKWTYDLQRRISDDKSPISSNWIDLIEIVSPHLSRRFKGKVSYYLNLKFIRRNIFRIYWELIGKNLEYIGNPPKRPHFYYKNSDEFILYLRSILLFFGLNPSHSFILYVPGKTEEIILQEYVERSWLKFLIKNMRGEDKSTFYKKVCEDIGDKEFYFLFDFHDLRNYKDKITKYGENCAFFIPDFITENFSIEQVFNAFLSVLISLGINTNEIDKEKILEFLKKEKEKSKKIIKDLEGNSSPSIASAKGFEKVLIKFLRDNFPREINMKFPFILLDKNGYITEREQKSKLKQEIKRILAGKLKIHLIDSLENDPDRKKDKFPFEIKIEPFINNMLRVINVASYWSST